MPRPHAYTIGQELLWNTAWGKPLPVTVTRLDGWSPQGEPEYLVRSERFDTEWSLGEGVIHTLPVETPELAPLLGIVGRKQVGKDSAAAELAEHYGFVRLAFADLLKDLALDINPIICHPTGLTLIDAVDRGGWEWAKQFPEGRQFLQRLGDRVRVRLGRDTWITPVITKANELRQQGVPVVISDVRYHNEAEAVKAAGGTLIKIVRPSEITDNHPSEAESDSIETDYEITNDTELGDLSTVVALLADYLNLHDYA